MIHPTRRSLLRSALATTTAAALAPRALLAQPAATGSPVTTKPATRPAAQPDPIIAGFLIGGSSDVVADRQVGRNLKRLGWMGFVTKEVRPAIAWGATRVEIHNPFGSVAGQDMQFDQAIHARDGVADMHPPIPWLTEGFVEAWRPITQSGVEVIAYLGYLKDDADFKALSPLKWLERFEESCRLPLEAGMSLGFDASAQFPADSREFAALELTRRLGVKVYVEGRPPKDGRHLWDYPIFMADNWFKRSNPTKHPDSAWAAPNEKLTGEIVRMVLEPPPGKNHQNMSWYVPLVKQIIADGHTAWVDVAFLARARVKKMDLVGKRG